MNWRAFLLNRYIVTNEPWVLAKTNPDRLATVMSHLIECLKIVSVLIWPFMPGSAETQVAWKSMQTTRSSSLMAAPVFVCLATH